MSGAPRTQRLFEGALKSAENKNKLKGVSSSDPIGPAAKGHRGDLMEVIEGEIIPRLCLTHRTTAEATCSETRIPPTQAEIFEFARIAACHDLTGAITFVENLCRQGLSLESVLIGLVAAAARLLGDHWQTDLRTFSEVTAALGTLQQVVHIFGPALAPSLPNRGLVVLVAAPGEQHTLGVFLVAEFLRRAGWGVHVDPHASEAELVRILRDEHVEMLGISVSSNALAEPIARMIATAKRASRNPNLAVVLGGSADLRSLAEKTGAHAFASDPDAAAAWLEMHGRTEAMHSS